jgi:transcriptional regulator with XRE-family HTH domain
MVNKAQPIGPTRERVAENVRQLREARGMSLNELSEQLRALGRPLRENGVSKIELGSRRVDVDDLVALAVALDVSPNRLLLTAHASDDSKDMIDLVAGGDPTVTTATAWRWACGDEPFEDLNRGVVLDLDRAQRFSRENRPHEPMVLSPREYEKHKDVLRRVVDAIDAARKRGLSLQDVVGYVSLRDMLDRMHERPAKAATKQARKNTRTRKAR